MQPNSGHRAFTLLLVFGAMVFGMVLAGGTDLTPSAMAQPELEAAKAVSVPVTTTSHGLPSLADLAEAVSPAVVAVQATTIESGNSRGGRNPLEFFFGPRGQDPRDQGQEQRQRRSDSSGSGFVISSDGLVVTNHHVIEEADGLTVHLDGRPYEAEVVGDDPATDLALLRIKSDEPLTYLQLGDSDSLRVGDWVMAIGSPLSLRNSVSVGVVSAKGRSINITPDSGLENFIQTDAAINFGNSGGPLVDLEGRVIGIATAINYGAENIGFAVPVETLRQILPQLRETGSVRRGYLGVGIGDLSSDDAGYLGLDSTDGAQVTQVMEGGPSAKAGLKEGDVIFEADGREISSSRELIDYIASRAPDTEVQLELLRNGKTLEKSVKLGQRPTAGGAVPVVEEESEEEGSIEWLGLEYRDLNSELREGHGIPEGVDGVWVSDVAATSPLYDKAVRPGNVIVDVNGKAVSSASEFEDAVRKAKEDGGYVRFYLRRFARDGNSNAFFATIKIP